MSASDFCSITSNSSSYYCNVYNVVGPLPAQYDFVYGIGAILMFVMFLLVVYAIISFLKAIGE